MNEMVKISDDEYLEKSVDARELWQYLESKREFSTWIKDRIEKYGFILNHDYYRFDNFVKGDEKGYGNIKKTEYKINLSMAKELALIENNIKGRMIRKYFIEVEEKFQELLKDPEYLLSIALQKSNEIIKRYQKKVEEYTENLRIVKPKADKFDDYMNASGLKSLGVVGRELGIGRNNIFKFLKERGIIFYDMGSDGKGIPCAKQEYLNRKLFVNKALMTKKDNIAYTKIFVTPKGESFIYDLIYQQGEINAC